MFTTNHSVADMYDDKYPTTRVASDKQGVVGLGHLKSDSVKKLRYFLMPSPWHLLEAVKGLLESAYDIQM